MKSIFRQGRLTLLFTKLQILDLSKSKAFAEDQMNMTEKLKFVFGRVENIAGKVENAGHQHFLLFQQCF